MTISHVPSYLKKINRINDCEHWPESIKSTNQGFPFHEIMEYTGNVMQDDTHLTSSLLKMFSMLEICLSCGDDDLKKLCLMCVNCKKETGYNTETGFK